ncbi:hypothetical protein SGQ44_18290 [Flavobacterium sp. Fl-77]|uniref:Uncharacterized protein n=1 Tax=Flavobacterium flavipigmentatum TaxID=2893884 RepID=A0AAJ2W2T2_9FLAO|nr:MULTISPECIES: hypothetical protein [unclassified Flavobacterium]MDX6181928.1 hypothetical protein [Flavobacterium sp. Fl-33]MDX6187705.1 hypothetical protein [Flavobacterium sp. Fl-77]UFH37148.1 hypothetical protein LNP22_10420 [Flavobacterium sp. F-70]
MNKLFYFCILFLIFGCSSSDDSKNNSSPLNPPTWIQGKWSMGTGDAQSGFDFKSDDWCIFGVGLSTCWKSTIESSNGQYKAEEIIGKSSYVTKFSVGGINQTYTFLKISDKQIRVTSPTGTLVYDKK